MSKYYNAESVNDEIVRVLEQTDCKDEYIDRVLRAIDSLPTIDIVRCGECKCCRDEFIEEYMPLYIYCEKWNHETDFDGFCSAGERIEE